MTQHLILMSLNGNLKNAIIINDVIKMREKKRLELEKISSQSRKGKQKSHIITENNNNKQKYIVRKTLTLYEKFKETLSKNQHTHRPYHSTI